MLKDHSQIQNALLDRNVNLASFWFEDPETRFRLKAKLLEKKALIVDAEDTFTAMLALQLKAIGLQIQLMKYHQLDSFTNEWDLIVMGPGPGDPGNLQDPRIARMHHLIKILLSEHRPFFAVCLSHQILSLQLGFPIERKILPKQGMQCEIEFYGRKEQVGFYNTYTAQCSDAEAAGLKDLQLEVCRDLHTQEVHSWKGPHYVSVQFHPESLLTRQGITIIEECIKGILKL